MGTWPHAPSKIVKGPGLYIITAGTYRKEPMFSGDEKLDLLLDTILIVAEELGWRLEAWAVFPNHYHLIGHAPNTTNPAYDLTKRIHARSAQALNRMDGVSGRKVWFNSWDTRLTYEKSYLARLAYVHQNPVKHGLVKIARDYRWCSAAWFEQNGEHAFVETVLSFPIDKVNVRDDF